MKKSEALVFRSRYRFLGFGTGIFCFLFCACWCYLRYTQNPVWLDFVEDSARKFQAVGGYGELIWWTFVAAMIFFGYLNLVHALMFRIQIFPDRIVQRRGFKSETVHWRDVERFYHPWWSGGGNYVLVCRDRKMWIPVGTMDSPEGLMGLIQENIDMERAPKAD